MEKDNPWSSGSIDKFLFYCCPECPFLEKDPEDFKKHATQIHENAKGIFDDDHKRVPEITEDIKEETLDPLDFTLENANLIPSFTKEESVDEHQTEPIIKDQEDKKPKERNKCPQCPKTYTFPGALATHLHLVHGIKENFPTPKKHRQKNTILIDDFPNLKRKQGSDNVIEGPETKKHCPRIQCYYCGELISSEDKVKEHILANHNSFASPKMYGDRRNFQCSNCLRLFKSQESLQIHVCEILPQSWLGQDQKSQKCPKCEKEFEKYGDILCHYNLEHKDSEENVQHFKTFFECKHCGKEYYAQLALNRHFINCNEKGIQEDNPLECLYCSEVCSSLEELDKHKEQRHKRVMQYYEPGCKLNTCNFRAKSKRQVLEHCKNEHQLYCVLCQEAFYFKHYLSKHHKEKHNNVKTLSCDSCDFKCGLLIDLSHHKKTVHEKKFAQVCDLCDKGFKNRYELSMHMESAHIKSKSILCEMCDYRCNTLRELKSHKVHVH